MYEQTIDDGDDDDADDEEDDDDNEDDDKDDRDVTYGSSSCVHMMRVYK